MTEGSGNAGEGFHPQDTSWLRRTDNVLINLATLVTPDRLSSQDPPGDPLVVDEIFSHLSPVQTPDFAQLVHIFSAKTNQFPDMAKKPSTSSLDRSDIVDFVVDDRAPEETKAIYNSWAPNYEEDMTVQKYKAPAIIAQFISQELKSPKTAAILDVGCGTGLLGVQLKSLGYSTMDGLDYSDEMLAEAKKKALYKRHFLEKVAKGFKLPMRDAEYDLVVLCGSLMPGHIMPDALPELARLVRTGGYLTWIHRTLDHYEHKSEQFLESRFTATLQALCKQQRMDLVVRKKVQDYRCKSDGQIFALKKK
ncbi:uncharacterized protein LOC135397523 [Ornithodoros turicata]|uniref:uncharacterized protein LOC135397523 n=1 Tax=Ornithodoros turicata TaxID=34597 RepID=UPI0031388987